MMPTFEVQTPDGAKFQISAETEDQAMAALDDALKQVPAEKTSMGFATRENREAEATREQKQDAYKEMARGARERQSPLMQYADTAVRGLARAVPVMDDIAAAGDYFISGKGENYQDALDRQRAFNEVDDTDRPVTSYGTQIVGGLALPAGAAKGSATALQAAGRAGAVGGAYGAAYGFGQGDDLEDRVSRAASGGLVGAAIGAPLGAAFHAVLPKTGAANEVVEAASRQGVNVPVAVATDSVALQRAASAARNVPFAGDPLVKATGEAVEQLGQRADDLARSAGGAGVEQAGETAAEGVAGWIKGKSGALVDKAYKAVDDLVDNSVSTELQSTRGVVADILAKRQNAHIAGESKAVNQVIDAVQSGGLNYEGIKTLRSSIGEMLNSGILPEGMSGQELKQIYGALSNDLKTSVKAAGGDKALAKFNRANSLNRLVSERREKLVSVVGKDGSRSPAQIYDRLIAAAGSKSRADTSLLLQARKAIGPDDWKEFSSALVGRLGRDVEGNFSPDRFVTDYGQLSAAGKSILFGASQDLRQALDDIATISAKMKDVQKKFGNPSGTAQNIAGGGLVAGFMTEPVSTIGALVGANAFTRIVSRPATATAMARYMKAQEAVLRKPARGTISVAQQAARQFADRVLKELGVALDPAQLFGGMRPGYAENDSEDRLRVGQ